MAPQAPDFDILFGAQGGAFARNVDWAATGFGAADKWGGVLRSCMASIATSEASTALILAEGAGVVFNSAFGAEAYGGEWGALGQPLPAFSVEIAPGHFEGLPEGRRHGAMLEPIRDETGAVIVYALRLAPKGSNGWQAAAREREERLHLVFDTARDYAIFTTDEEGVVDGWPPGAEAVFGWAASEIIGQSADLLYTPEDRAAGVPEQEIEMARQTGRAPDVRWHQHKSGRRVFIEGAVRPLPATTGTDGGFLKIGQDTTERRKNEIALKASEERFRVLTNSIPHLVFRGSVTGDRSWNSTQWLAYTGQTADDACGFGWLEAVHPEDRTKILAAWDEAKGKSQFVVEHRIRRGSDGGYRWFETIAVCIASENFSADEWVGTSSDIHVRQQSKARQDIMVAELHHRTYNLLAVVRAIFTETFQTSDTPAAFHDRFSERLAALSRVQGMLNMSDTGKGAVADILAAEFDAMAPGTTQIAVDGPHVTLPSSTVQILALAMHELCTNALKHGALADNHGRLSVSWDVVEHLEGRDWLRLLWEEQFGRVRGSGAAKRRGLGRDLIERALPYQLGARTSLDIANDHVTCMLMVPLDHDASA